MVNGSAHIRLAAIISDRMASVSAPADKPRDRTPPPGAYLPRREEQEQEREHENRDHPYPVG
jgi:hypothetical protein